jgi:polygalacturonase
MRALAGLVLMAACLTAVAAGPAGTNSPAASASLSVLDFGARADGVTKDTAAFQKALDACASRGGGTVLVPKGIYLIGSIVLGSNTVLRLENRANLCGSSDPEDYPLERVRWEGEYRQGHRAMISASKANNLTIAGHGSIFGPPLSVSRLRDPRGPSLIEISDSTNVVMEGFTTQYQQLWSIHVSACSNLVVRGLTIRSVNVNGDGIDVDSCREVLIEECNIDTGDDAISLKSGRGMEAVRLGLPTENVVIRDCTLVSSIFAGIGIGSEMSGGIRNVRLENCLLSGRQNAIYIKSRAGRGGFIENITGENLTIRQSPTFVAISLIKIGIQASEPVPGNVEQYARVRNLVFKDVRLDRVGELFPARDIPVERPVDGLTLDRITGTCGKGITLVNMTNVTLGEIQVTGLVGPLLQMTNVQGSGLEKYAGK